MWVNVASSILGGRDLAPIEESLPLIDGGSGLGGSCGLERLPGAGTNLGNLHSLK